MSASSYAAGRPAPRPALRLRLRLRGWCAQLALFAAAYAVYGLSRYVVVGDLATAQDHARWIVDLQRALGVDVERDVQRALDAGAVRWLLNNVYLAAQLVVVPGSLVALYRRAPRVYRALRDTVLATWLLAVPVYALFPVAPPRLADIGLVDTITAHGTLALDSRLTTALYNPIAAVPSLHAGFALAVSVALAAVTPRTWLRALAALWAPLVGLTVVATGNHFVFDIAAGVVAVGAGYLAGRLVRRMTGAGAGEADEGRTQGGSPDDGGGAAADHRVTARNHHEEPVMPPTDVRQREHVIRDRLRASPWLVLVLVAFGEFMVVLDATIVNVALPSIQEDLGFSSRDLQWVVNGYTLLFGGFLLLGGRAADLFGRRRVFLTGMTLFTLASVANVLAASPEVLVAGRALQGLGAALVSPAALSIITSTFPSGPERTRALSIWAGVAAGGAGVGLLLGGVLTDALSWEWVFLINVPIGVATFALTTRFVPESRVVGRRGFDVLGALTVTAGLLLLVYAIVKAEEYGWGSARTLLVGAASVALLAAFVAIELRQDEPLVRLSIFRVRSVAVANTTAVLTSSAMFPLFFFGSLYLQGVKGFSPIESGAGFLPFTASVLLGAGLAQRSLPRFGARAVSAFGLLLAAAALLYLSRLEAGSDYLGAVVPGFAAMGFGVGNAWLPMTMAATGNVDAEHQGLASGLVNTSQQIGGALGLAVLSTLANERTVAFLAESAEPGSPAVRAAAAVDGFTLGFAVGAGLLLAAFVLLLARMRPEDVDVRGGLAAAHGGSPVGVADEPAPAAA